MLSKFDLSTVTTNVVAAVVAVAIVAKALMAGRLSSASSDDGNVVFAAAVSEVKKVETGHVGFLLLTAASTASFQVACSQQRFATSANLGRV